MEILDIVDENGCPTGETVTRERAHREGIRHRTAHVWIFRERDKKVQILLQKRSEDKDSYPGCYDISSAGHIPAGEDYIPSALRELKEELGVTVEAEELGYCGQRRFWFEKEFYGELFRDNQVSNIYCLWLDWEESDFVLQKEEVSKVRWMDFDECVEAVSQNLIPHCIYMEELDILRRADSLSLKHTNR